MKSNTDPKSSAIFKNWYRQIISIYGVTSVDVQSVDYVRKGDHQKVIFMKVKAVLVDSNGDRITRVFFLRGLTVIILVVLTVDGVEYTLLTRQPRPAIGQVSYPEIPAGIIEGETPRLAAFRELYEETGISASPEDLTDMCESIYQGTWEGIYPSPGACDEMAYMFLYRKEIDQSTLKELKGKHTGCEDENEHITLEVVLLKDLYRYTPSPATHSALLMYQKMKEKGDLK